MVAQEAEPPARPKLSRRIMQNVIAQRVIGAARFDRESYLWMLWNERASGDAALLVLGTDLLVGIGLVGLDLTGLLSWILAGLIFWLVYSGIAWAAARHLFGGSGQYIGVMRIVGFGYPTRLLILAFVVLMEPSIIAVVLGTLWLVAIVANGLKEAMEVTLEQGIMAAALGVLGYLVVIAIFSF